MMRTTMHRRAIKLAPDTDTQTKRPARVSLEPNDKSANTRKTGCKNSSSSSSSSNSSSSNNGDDGSSSSSSSSSNSSSSSSSSNNRTNTPRKFKPLQYIWSKLQVRNHDDFIKLVADATDPAKNDLGDEILYEMFTKKELMNGGRTVDYLFCKTVSGKPNKQSKTITDQALKIWTTHVTNLKNGKPLDFETHQVYIRKVFSVFHSKGVEYTYNDFKHQRGFVAVVNADWKGKKIEDLMLGKIQNKAKFDEFVDEKFKKDYLKLGVFAYGAMKDLECIIIAPSGGFCKTKGLNINNPTENKQHPMVVEDPENPNCIIKLIYFYWARCNESQPKSPVGAGTIRKWHAKSAEPYIHQNSNTQKRVQGALSSGLHYQKEETVDLDVEGRGKLTIDNGNNIKKNSSNNKPPIAPSTKKVIIDPAAVLGTKEPSPSKDRIKKEVQQCKKDSKELKKENKKQRTKLQDAEEDVNRLTIDLKESNNINKTLTNEFITPVFHQGRGLSLRLRPRPRWNTTVSNTPEAGTESLLELETEGQPNYKHCLLRSREWCVLTPSKLQALPDKEAVNASKKLSKTPQLKSLQWKTTHNPYNSNNSSSSSSSNNNHNDDDDYAYIALLV
eukprot:jgi/Psemu1/24965/gm1.24965_g